MPRPRRRNPWTTTGEVFIWVLFAALLIPAGFAGWAVGHYTSLGGKPSATVVHTVTIGSTSTPGTATSAATTTSAGTTTSAKGGGGDVAAGKAIFTGSAGCAGCHTFKPAGSTGTVGPDLDTAPAQDAKADGNKELADFIEESIKDPDAYIAKGYSKGVMPSNFDESLSSKQLNDLVAFIVSGSSSS